MAKQSYTKDEIYILTLHAAALKADDCEQPFNKYDIGTAAGMHARGVDATTKLLLRANFIKKSSEEEIFLTAHGRKLAESLLEKGK
jgi:predicted transcriptional regulator